MAVTGGPNSGNTFFQQDGELWFWKPNGEDKVGPFKTEKELQQAWDNYAFSEQFMKDREEAVAHNREQEKKEFVRLVHRATVYEDEAEFLKKLQFAHPSVFHNLVALLTVAGLRKGLITEDEVVTIIHKGI